MRETREIICAETRELIDTLNAYGMTDTARVYRDELMFAGDTLRQLKSIRERARQSVAITIQVFTVPR